jgi:hypothetical protein
LHRVVPSIMILILAHRRDWMWIAQELRVIPAFIFGLVIGKCIVIAAAAMGITNIHQLMHAWKH